MDTARIVKTLDKVVEFLVYLIVAVVPAVYYNNPIATEYFFSKAFFFDFLLYLAFALFFLRGLLARDLRIRWGLTFPAVAVFALVMVTSLIGATNVWKGWETVLRVGAAVPFLFLMYQVVGTREGVKRFIAIAAMVNIGITVYGFLQYYEVFPLPKDQYGTPDPSTTIGLTNFVMEYLSPFMFVLPAMIIVEKRRFWRAVYLASTICVYYYFAISQNLAAIVGWGSALPLLALLLIAQYRRGSFRFSRTVTAAFTAIAIAATIGVVTSPLGQSAFKRVQGVLTGNVDSAIKFRMETWKESLVVFAGNPVRGVGLSNLEVVFPLYQSPYLQRMTLTNNTRVVRAHNEYIQVLVDLGMLGGIAFVWFLVSLVRLGWRAYRSAVEWDDLLLISGLLLGTFSYLVMAFFAFPLEVPSSALSIFLVIGLFEVMTRRVLRPGEDRSWLVPPKALMPVGGIAVFASVVMWVYSSTWMWNVLKAEVYFKESRVMKDLRYYAEAKSLLDRAIDRYPTNEAYYYDRSVFALRENNIPVALQDLNVTASLVPYYGMGRKQMGMLYARMGDWDRATEELKLAYRIYRNYPQEYVPLIVSAQIGAGRAREAVETFEETLSRGFDDTPEVFLAGGQAYLGSKNHEKAVEHLEKALELRPGYGDAKVYLGIAHQEAGNYEEAVRVLEDARRTDRESQHALTRDLSLVKSLVGLKRIDEAKAVLTSTIASNPAARTRARNDAELSSVPEFAPILAR